MRRNIGDFLFTFIGYQLLFNVLQFGLHLLFSDLFRLDSASSTNSMIFAMGLALYLHQGETK